jgi:ketosteroid isomerase-like protein
VPPTNVETLRRFWELAASRREFDAAMDLVNDDAEFDWSDSRAPYRGRYRGRADIQAAWSVWLEAWDVWDPQITESIEVDDKTVVIATRVHARGKGSGVPVEAHGASVWTFRDGKISTAKLFQSKSAALASVGLSG